jgi:hypothetical protein
MRPTLFNNRAYLIDSTTLADPIDEKALGKILRSSGIDGTISSTQLLSEENDYDNYQIELDDGTLWRLKISFDKNTPVLKREAAVLKNSDGVATGQLHLLSDSTLGQKLPHLIFQFPPALSASDLGKSFLIKERELLFNSYFALLQTLSPKRQYNSIVRERFKTFNIAKSFPRISRDAIKAHSDYEAFVNFFTALRKETEAKLFAPMGEKCLGGLPFKGIFFFEDLFFFDYLHDTCLHHPFADLVDLVLDLGVNKETEDILFKEFCEIGNLKGQEYLYQEVYDIQLRKKLVELVGQYLTEVYMFGSRGIDDLIYLADNFFQCSERFRRIPTFLDNQDFLFKTITEPVLGVKA